MTDILENGLDEARTQIEAMAKRGVRFVSRTKMPTDTPFVGMDSEGNFWGYAYINGKRVRVCIPND